MRARQQLGHAERLDHVIVGAEFEQPDFLGFAGAHREHDQRHARPGAQPLQHFGAVHVGQAEIENHQIGRLQRRRAQRFGAGLGLLHREAVEFEAGAQEAADLNFVVDDENGRRDFIHRHVDLHHGRRRSPRSIGVRRNRQMDRHRRAAVGAFALDLDLAAVGGDEGVGDPQSEARARRGGGMARAAEEALADLVLLLAGQAGAAIVHREHDGLPVADGRRR